MVANGPAKAKRVICLSFGESPKATVRVAHKAKQTDNPIFIVWTFFPAAAGLSIHLRSSIPIRKNMDNGY